MHTQTLIWGMFSNPTMELEVVGRHALLFDDDAGAAFVNSRDALVDWHSLKIDRYDVRHLLSSPPPPRRNNRQQSSSLDNSSSLESHLDLERYLDLPPSSDQPESDEGAKLVDAGSYRAVGFSYGSTDDSADQNNADAGLGSSGFCPPFPMPESLRQSLPPSEKVHQIISRTAMFVSKHGGQSEIILRVKQGDNPTFGFLMPDHHLHAYFRFLVDHQEVLQFDIDGKPQCEEQKTDVVGGALSLLGSVYGSGEDEEDAPESKENASGETLDTTNATVSAGSEKTESWANAAAKDESVYKHPLPSKEKALVLKRNYFTGVSKVESTSSTRKGDSTGLLSTAMDKLAYSATSMSKTEPLILEPPSDLKRLVDKIVEFIMKNGKEFETLLVDQDSKYQRFPFLLPSNQYYPYYLKVLQKAQESKLMGKSFLSEKDDSVGPALDKKNSLPKESNSLYLESGSCDVPHDFDRKEKFKMVIGKSRKEGQESQDTTQQQFGVTVDAASAAAILQAATRGIKNPNLGILSSTSLNGNSHGINGGQASSLSSLPASQLKGIVQKSDQNEENSISPPVAKAMAKPAAAEAASEADSSEAHLTKEQKLKAERLKRAKMFVSMLKSGGPPSKTEPLCGLSTEPQESGVSGFGTEVHLAANEREGSSAPSGINTFYENAKSRKKYPSDELNERRSRRKYRSRSGRREDDEEEEDNEEEEIDEDERDNKNSRKKHRSHRSSHADDDERDGNHSRKKHRSRHSSRADDGEEDEEIDDKRSRRKQRYHHSAYEDEEDDNERDHTHSRKNHPSPHSSHEEEDEERDYEEQDHKRSRKKLRSSHRIIRRERHKHRKRHSSKDTASQHQRELDSSSHDEHRHLVKSHKHRKRSHSDTEELEEGEISSRISDQSRGNVGVGVSREVSVDLSSSYQDRRAPSETSGVSEDLRAKIRAMLMANL